MVCPTIVSEEFSPPKTPRGRRDHISPALPLASVALASSTETRWLQTSVFCLLVFLWPCTSVPRRRHTSGLRKSSTAATLFHRQIVCCSTHTHTTTYSATGASLSPGHVFGTVFRSTCATRTLHTTVSGVNSKRFLLADLTEYGRTNATGLRLSVVCL